MSEEKKQIFIDPNMFNPGAYTGGKTNKQRIKPDKQLKIKPSKTVSIKSQRQQFMKKLREKQEQQYISMFSSEKPLPKAVSNKEENEFISDFDKSLEFMNAVSSAPLAPATTPAQQIHSHTIKNHNSYLNIEPPKYGCLKGGNLPTKRASVFDRISIKFPAAKSLSGSISIELTQNSPIVKHSITGFVNKI